MALRHLAMIYQLFSPPLPAVAHFVSRVLIGTAADDDDDDATAAVYQKEDLAFPTPPPFFVSEREYN
jgi:hypothetical protein